MFFILNSTLTQIAGFTLAGSMVLCLGVFGVFFLLGGSMFMAMSNNDPEFWSHFDRTTSPGTIMGAILFTVGGKFTNSKIVDTMKKL